MKYIEYIIEQEHACGARDDALFPPSQPRKIREKNQAKWMNIIFASVIGILYGNLHK